MFWSATGGGVRRYLLTKHAGDGARRLAAHDRGAGPGREPGSRRPPFAAVAGSGGYRLPLAAQRASPGRCAISSRI